MLGAIADCWCSKADPVTAAAVTSHPTKVPAGRAPSTARSARADRTSRNATASHHGEARAARAAAQATAPSRGARRSGLIARSQGEVRGHVSERLVADAVDLEELVDRGERAVRRAPVEDLLGGDRTDAGQAVELVEGGGVEVHQRTVAG